MLQRIRRLELLECALDHQGEVKGAGLQLPAHVSLKHMKRQFLAREPQVGQHFVLRSRMRWDDSFNASLLAWQSKISSPAPVAEAAMFELC